MDKIKYKARDASILEAVRAILEDVKFNHTIYKYCAVDADGAIYVFEAVPAYNRGEWLHVSADEGCKCFALGNVGDHISYRAGDCMWELDPQ